MLIGARLFSLQGLTFGYLQGKIFPNASKIWSVRTCGLTHVRGIAAAFRLSQTFTSLTCVYFIKSLFSKIFFKSLKVFYKSLKPLKCFTNFCLAFENFCFTWIYEIVTHQKRLSFPRIWPNNTSLPRQHLFPKTSRHYCSQKIHLLLSFFHRYAFHSNTHINKSP